MDRASLTGSCKPSSCSRVFTVLSHLCRKSVSEGPFRTRDCPVRGSMANTGEQDRDGPSSPQGSEHKLTHDLLHLARRYYSAS